MLAGQVGQSTSNCYMKAGYERTCISVGMGGVANMTIFQTEIDSTVWNNISANVTSLNFYSGQANGFGIGSHIEVWARR